jgi:hypothetical protein
MKSSRRGLDVRIKLKPSRHSEKNELENFAANLALDGTDGSFVIINVKKVATKNVKSSNMKMTRIPNRESRKPDSKGASNKERAGAASESPAALSTFSGGTKDPRRAA